MKQLLFALLFCVSLTAQNYTVDQPRMRVNRTAPLTLSTTWQTVDFNGTSTFNVNDFGNDPTTGKKMVSWDATAKLFRIYGDYNNTYLLQLFPTTTTTAVSVRSTLQYRIVIPNGNGAGSDLYIPYPEAGGYADINEVTILSTQMQHNPIIFGITATPAIRANGFYVQVRLSTLITLGSCTLNNCAFLIQSLK